MNIQPEGFKSPGVYIDEVNAFPNSVVEVATAVPVFIGYTPQAMYEGKSHTNVPTKISSFADFKAIFCNPDPPAPTPPASQYSPQYYTNKSKEKPNQGDYYTFNGAYYTIEPDQSTIYYLYNSVKLFYQNGGGDAYIVSVGSYGPEMKQIKAPGAPIVNPNVQLNDLLGGLSLVANEQEITLYVVPEATLLEPDNNGTLMETMLAQNASVQTAMSLLDLIGGNEPDPIMYTEDVENFRNSTGMNGLMYGAAYYPFLKTTITQPGEITYLNLNGGDVKALSELINPPQNPNEAAATILSQIEAGNSGLTPVQLNSALIAASKTYSQILNIVMGKVNVLPPSGAMAGIYTLTDNTQGVWNAPANVTPIGVSGLTLDIDSQMQEGLNIDAVSGKSINAIRFFNGQGILVWGARTLDGNSQDWRYISVRRTVTMIEQSCKLAMRAYVFEPNTANTWAAVNAMISSFLTNVWKMGGLQGATAADAFSVSVGLGSTMTAEDILNGIMRVSVKIAVVHPAEFIIIQLEQEMAKS